MSLLRRNAAALAAEIMATSPITVLSGARQVGKSTLMQQLASNRDARIVSLDSAVDRAAAERDPDGFAQQHPSGTLAIDEIQRVPKLLIAVKHATDLNRTPGRFILTGSADLLTIRGGQESLAGRAQTVALDGLSRGEIEGTTEDFAHYAWNLPNGAVLRDVPDISRRDYLELSSRSTFPEIRDLTSRQQVRWLNNYSERVLSKDAAEVSGIQHPDRLRPLLQLIAAENATEFVAAHVARQLDIPPRSVPAYLRALRDVFLVRELPAWGANLSRRVISKPKVSIADPGLAAALSGADIDGLERDIAGALTGGLVEGFVTSEIAKQRTWSAIDTRLHHFRDSGGREVDLVLENPRREVVGVEVKATSSITARHFRGLEFLRDSLGAAFVAGVVLYTGHRSLRFGDRLWALPIGSLWRATV
ncbi:ATP-binding protein [Microbacterium sp.]|uniref:ATP-binding protein n=1 Tax=Microbacterium sp. TaxID=51671 RepID=UPI00262E9CD3|nr:ATP-binding protein [uncultured Microbacterium sp.]